MTLPREVVVDGMVAEYEMFAELVRNLSDSEWVTPSRCAGWQVRDVAAHVVGVLTDVIDLRLEGLGTPEVTQRQVEERRGEMPATLAAELEKGVAAATGLASSFDDEAWGSPAPGGIGGTLGFGIEALWFDTYVHADDIRAALGRPSERGDGVRASVSHVAQVLSDQGWGPATLRLTGLEDFAVSGGGGRTITAEPLAFVLVATGRADPGPLGLDESVNIYR